MIIAILITTAYVILIIAFWLGFNNVNETLVKTAKTQVKFSILIPFRNEAKMLPLLLKSINALTYDKTLFEVLFIDDASKDNSVVLIKKLLDKTINYKILSNQRTSNSPKKDALTLAINQAKNSWIITTDADCILPKKWLNSFAYFIATNDSKFIAAPVQMQLENGFWKQFQTHDFLALQGVTIGAFGLQKPFMCNGANLCYQKEAFFTVNGFEGNTNLASGDDVFLLEKMQATFPKKVHYLKAKDAIVKTFPVATLQELKQQRVRWASKSSAYKNTLAIIAGLIMLAMTLNLILSLFLLQFKLFLILFLVKFSIDLVLLYPTAKFFSQTSSLKTFVFSSFVYPFFTVYISILALFKQYQWKGRKLS